MSRLLCLVTIATMGVVSACHRSHLSGESVPMSAASDTVGVVLEVENHNWSDIDIYILHDDRRDRLVTVTAAQDASLRIPSQYLGDTGIFRLLVYRIDGSGSYVSDPVSIRTGNTVRLTVESSLGRSSVGVW